MLQRFQDRVGTAGLIVAIVALVAAMGGGAYAAKSALSHKQKKEVEKIAKQHAGKPGKPGAPGATGPTGAPGPTGAKGDTGATGATGKEGPQGKEGKEGPPGEPGEPGESVEAVTVPTGQTTCGGNGGAVIEPQEVEVCNGSPWAVGGLPSGKTEMGAWAFGDVATPSEALYAPISFSVPLEAGKTVDVHFVNALGEEEELSLETNEFVTKPATICTGTQRVPTAPAGVLCVYEQFVKINGAVSPAEITAHFSSASGAGVATGPVSGKAGIAGARLNFQTTEAEGFASGSWAVTAP